MKFAIPMCYADPAFMACLYNSGKTPEFVANFDRLKGTTLTAKRSPIESMIDRATGKEDADAKAFVEFVHEAVYMRMPDEAIDSLRDGYFAIESHTK